MRIFFILAFLLCAAGVYAQQMPIDTNIDYSHRGYKEGEAPASSIQKGTPSEISTTKASADEIYNVDNTDNEFVDIVVTPARVIDHKLLLTAELGYLYTENFDYGYDFDMPVSGMVGLTLLNHVNKYFGFGGGLFYHGALSHHLRDIVNNGDDIQLNYSTISPTILGTVRYPIGKYFEPYITVGLSYNINALEYDYEYDGQTETKSTNGKTIGYSGAIGFRVYPTTNLFIGVVGKYLHNSQTVSGYGNIDMGGQALLLTIGYAL
ncbi:MAG: porin family protein [Deferribacteraceae bacterium]|nr:porin family protein [Deferribacteraceae bacterium]